MPSSSDKNRVKICILTSAHPPFDARIFHKEAKTLVKAGYSVVLIAQHNKEEIVDGVRIVPLPTPKNRFERMTKVVWKLFKLALKEKAKIYHFHDPELIPVGTLLKILRKQVTYDIHEDYPETMLTKDYLPRFLRRPFKVIMKYTEKLVFHFFDGLVFTTEGQMKKCGNPNKKQVVLHNYPSTEAFSHIPLDTEKKYDLVHLGSVYPWRMRFMIKVGEALKKIRPDFTWIFIGVGKTTIEWTRTNMSSTLNDNYFFVKQMPYFDALILTSKAKIGFTYHPPGSRFEVLVPTKVFEYMALGLPVVCASMAELDRLLGKYNGKMGFLVSEDVPEYFAEKIDELLCNEDDIKRIGTFNQELFRTSFNWSEEADKLVNFYGNFLNEGKKTNNK